MYKRIMSLVLCVVILAGVAAIGMNASATTTGLSISGKAVVGGIKFTITKSTAAKNYVSKHKGCYYLIRYEVIDRITGNKSAVHKIHKSANTAKTETIKLNCQNNRTFCVMLYLVNKSNVKVYDSNYEKYIDSYLAPIKKFQEGTDKYIHMLYQFRGVIKYKLMIKRNGKWTTTTCSNEIYTQYYSTDDESRWKPVKNGTFEVRSLLNSGTFHLRIHTHQPGEKITYAIAAYNRQNQLGPWTTNTVQILSKLNGKLTVSKPTNNTHKFTWTKAAGATKYYVKITQINNQKTIYHCFTTKNTITLSKGISKNVNYKISVTPYNSSGKGLGAMVKFKG